MTRPLAALILTALTALTAPAHFVFVVPATDAKSAQVVFSEDLEPDDNVTVEKIAGITLTARHADGKEVPVEAKAEKHHLTAALPEGAKLVFGSVSYGVSARAGAKPALLMYHPKAVLGAAEAPPALAAKAKEPELELVPVVEAGATRFRLLAKGRPVEGADGSVLKPDGTKEKVKTDKDGYTKGFTEAGRYGAWAKQAEAKAGEHGGQKYEEVRHYATLVVDVAAAKGK